LNALSKRIAEFDEEQLAQIYKNCFNTEAGGMVLEDLKMRMFFYTTSFDRDPYQSAFQSGQLAALKYILTQLNNVSDSLAPAVDS
jgi:hypothetical protein